MKARRSLFFRHAPLISSVVFAAGLQAQTTGFLQTDAGPYDYNEPTNWVAGNINGIWDSTLTLTATQAVTFASDTVLSTPLTFDYAGNFDLTLRSDGLGARTITLGGNIAVNPASNRTINVGSLTANQGLHVDLGGDRTFVVGGSKALNFFNTITGGDLTILGPNTTSTGGTFRLSRTNGEAANSDITVGNNATFQIDNSSNGFAGNIRAENVALVSGGKLSVRGNNNTNTVETFTGDLTTDGGFQRLKFSANNYHSVSVDAGNAHTLLSFANLNRANKGTLLVRGDNLGVNPIASTTAGSSNIEITGGAPAQIGGGGTAGTTNISIVPWLVGGVSLGDSGSTLVTYDAANGLRPLDTGTEFASAIGGSPTDNVRLSSGTDTAISGNQTVNSLILGTPGSSISGSDTLTVTSGAILITRTTGSATPINVNLNFGSAEGIIGFLRGETVNGTIAGSGGLTIHGNRNDETLNLLNGSSTYTGDTTILSNALVATGFLPHGTRTGDVYVHGNLQLNTSGYLGTINGLFGSGVVAYGNSGDSSLTIGDNNSNGSFTGQIVNTNGKLKIVKIGGGTQSIAGAHSWGRGTELLGGVWSIDSLTNGASESGIGSSSSIASNLIINGGTLRYTGPATSSDRLFTTGAFGATLDASGTGELILDNAGNHATAEAANRNGTRTSGSNIVTGVIDFTDLTVGARVTGTGIPAGATITALNPGAGEFTLSANSTANINNGNMVIATDRALTLTGSNTGDNVLTANLADGSNGGALKIVKSGAGKWFLGGTNTYSGNTEVLGGTLVLSQINPSNESSQVRLASSATLTLNFAGTDTVDALFINGAQQPAGVYKAIGNPASGTAIAQLSGTGTLTVTSGPAPGGGYSDWSIANAGGQDPDEDFDNDGVANGVEYFLNAPAGFTAMPGVSSGAISWTNGGNIDSSAYGSEFVVQTSTDLVVWTDVEESDEDLDNQAGSVSYTLPTGETKIFVRLAVNPQ